MYSYYKLCQKYSYLDKILNFLDEGFPKSNEEIYMHITGHNYKDHKKQELWHPENTDTDKPQFSFLIMSRFEEVLKDLENQGFITTDNQGLYKITSQGSIQASKSFQRTYKKEIIDRNIKNSRYLIAIVLSVTSFILGFYLGCQ